MEEQRSFSDIECSAHKRESFMDGIEAISTGASGMTLSTPSISRVSEAIRPEVLRKFS